ncbi:MAG: hypothetical protein B0A82_16100 [Alkalinema sp. CACIAM 70d]|nr:MAG: hypothetical protein B0A82_16100 [Alkalinema sp. CACIAM 70d]
MVHLHGSIRLVTEENVLDSLVLGEASYVNQYVTRSPWYDQFQRDLAYASAVYIVGYNLGDYHIAALLMANPAVAARTVFIQGPNQTTFSCAALRNTAGQCSLARMASQKLLQTRVSQCAPLLATSDLCARSLQRGTIKQALVRPPQRCTTF